MCVPHVVLNGLNVIMTTFYLLVVGERLIHSEWYCIIVSGWFLCFVVKHGVGAVVVCAESRFCSGSNDSNVKFCQASCCSSV
jgi:hypothetical protein